MRKALVSVLLVFFAYALATAQEGSIFDGPVGTYAIYHDARFGDDVFIGLCYIGEDTLLVRSYETKTQNELLMLIPFVREEGEGIGLGQEMRVIRGDMQSSKASARLLPMLMNWSQTWYSLREKIREKNEYQASTDDDYAYKAWIPVFQLSRIGDKKDFRVVSVGILSSNADPRFFLYNEEPKPQAAESYKIDKKKRSEVTIDGIRFSLDENWKTDDSRVYRLQKVSPQDAVLTVETFDYAKAGIPSVSLLASLIVIGNSEVTVLMDGTELTKRKDSYELTLRMYDPGQGKVTVQKSRIIEKGEGVVSMTSLACYETLYLENKAYFDSILK